MDIHGLWYTTSLHHGWLVWGRIPEEALFQVAALLTQPESFYLYYVRILFKLYVQICPVYPTTIR